MDVIKEEEEEIIIKEPRGGRQESFKNSDGRKKKFGFYIGFRCPCGAKIRTSLNTVRAISSTRSYLVCFLVVSLFFYFFIFIFFIFFLFLFILFLVYFFNILYLFLLIALWIEINIGA